MRLLTLSFTKLIASILLSACSTSQHIDIIKLPKQTFIDPEKNLLRDDLFEIAKSNGDNSSFNAPHHFHINSQNPESSTDILAVNQDIRTFINSHRLNQIKDPYKQLSALQHALLDTNKLNLQYKEGKTKTAIETFTSRTANCLSFANLFIAIAREIGIETHYQQVDTPPSWNKEGSTLIIDNHINVRAIIDNRHRRYSRASIQTHSNSSPLLISSYNRLSHISNSDEFIADFSPNIDRLKYSAKVIPDNHATALFYNNMAIDYLLKKNFNNAYLYTKKAIQHYPKESSIWNNLGSIYKRTGHFDLARQAYLYALELNANELTAASNLIRLYQKSHQYDKADPYIKYIEDYRQANPYYHYEQGLQAIDRNAFTQAANHFNQAIKLKKDEDVFYFTLASVYYKLGKIDKAIRQIRKAKKQANKESKRRYYDEKIQALKNKELFITTENQ